MLKPLTADNLQSFTGNLGAAADAITFSGDTTRSFEVKGNTFVNFAYANPYQLMPHPRSSTQISPLTSS